jgi:hypothetical protein
MAIPTAVAIQCVEVTTPNVPSISGLVVNGSGLMWLNGLCLSRWPALLPGWTTAWSSRRGPRALEVKPSVQMCSIETLS